MNLDSLNFNQFCCLLNSKTQVTSKANKSIFEIETNFRISLQNHSGKALENNRKWKNNFINKLVFKGEKNHHTKLMWGSKLRLAELWKNNQENERKLPIKRTVFLYPQPWKLPTIIFYCNVWIFQILSLATLDDVFKGAGVFRGDFFTPLMFLLWINYRLLETIVSVVINIDCG